MTASLSRFAHNGQMRSGERQTVRHTIGSQRSMNEDVLKMLSTGHHVRSQSAAARAF